MKKEESNNILRALLFLVFFSLTAFLCEEHPPVEVIIQSDCIDNSLINENADCPAIIAYVCGCNGETYENSCIAYINGVVNHTVGECR